MKKYIYPGTFCPPTIGHLRILQRACSNFPSVTVVCSINPNKPKPSSYSDRIKLWKTYSNLPLNCNFVSLQDFIYDYEKINPKWDLTIIRGLRNIDELQFEQEVMLNAIKRHNVQEFHYILSELKYRDVSSSKVRELIKLSQFDEAIKLTNPDIVKHLIVHQIGE